MNPIHESGRFGVVYVTESGETEAAEIVAWSPEKDTLLPYVVTGAGTVVLLRSRYYVLSIDASPDDFRAATAALTGGAS